MPRTRKAELVIDAKATVGEGAIWHARRRRLYWVGIPDESGHYKLVQRTFTRS